MKTFKQFTEEHKFGPNWNDGFNVRFKVGGGEKKFSVNYNGTPLYKKETKTTYTGRSPETAVRQGEIALKNKQNAHIAQNYIAKKNAEKNNKDVLIAKK